MTITGKILLATGSARNTKVRFVPLSNPQVHNLGLLTAPGIEVHTDKDGNLPLSLILKSGDYAVLVGYNKRDVFNISVEDSDASADIKTLALTATVEVYRPQFWLPKSGVNYEFDGDYLKLRNLTSGLFNPMIINSSGGLTLGLNNGVTPNFATDPASRIGTYYRQSTNGDFQIKDINTGSWYPIKLAGPVDNQTHWEIWTPIGCEELQADGYMPYAGRNFRDHNHELQFYNRERNVWQSVYTDGLGPAVHFVFRSP